MLIPSIDLMGGKAVQLRQGKTKILERSDVFELLEEFSVFGEVAVIDLDAALGEGDNRELIKQLLKRKSFRVGGGIRDLEVAREYLKAGASKIILGSCCQEKWVQSLDKNRLIFAIDAKGDYWSTKGWTEVSAIRVLDLIPQLEPSCSEFLYTQIENEGMLQGIDHERIEQVNQLSKIPITVAGGISTLDDTAWISQKGCHAQIGMSIYQGKINLVDAFKSQCDFEKSSLVPTIVQDANTDKILMLAYSSQESLTQALAQKSGIYYSRSRQQLWKKGETSGNTQTLVQADVDCDGDSIIFRVIQNASEDNPKQPFACHFDRYSCFPAQIPAFSLNRLSSLLTDRLANRPLNSFTTQLFASPSLRAEKITEEGQELIEAETFEEVRWEAADLLYFTLVDAKAKGVDIQDIVNELGSRFNDN